MEVIKFDKGHIDKEFTACNELGQIVRQFEKQNEVHKKVICTVKVNGLLLSEEDEVKFAHTRVAEIHSLEFELEDVALLARESVDSLCQFLKSLKDEAVNVAELFRDKRTNDAQHQFAVIMGHSQWAIQALAVVKPNLMRADEALLEERWKTNEVHMMNTVQELLAAYESQDYVLLSDVLEYELHNSIEKWIEILVM